MGPSLVPYNLDIVENCSCCPTPALGLFCSLPQRTLSELNSCRQNSLYPREAVLFVEGQTPRGLYILCSGQAKLSASSESGHVINLHIAEQGELLGLGSVILNRPHVLRAETLCPSQICFIPRLQLMQLIRAHADLALSASKNLSMELYQAYDLACLLALAPTIQMRVAQFLVSQAEKKGRPVAKGIHLAVNMTQAEIGESIGASRETVSRILGDFRRKQLIRVNGGSIVILQPQRLRCLTTTPSSHIH
jgi:CRP/FNR family cyclic AMP-dependent transcriptional regulator